MSRDENIRRSPDILPPCRPATGLMVEDMYHDNIVIHMAGSTPASGRLMGKATVTTGLIAQQVHAALDPKRMHFAKRWKVMCADEERVVVIMEGGGPTLTGDNYDQTYCEIFRFEDDKVIEMYAFFDTALAERALFGNPLLKNAKLRLRSSPTQPRIMGQLDGRVCLVTGAGRGIGAAIATAFVQAGAEVVLTDIHKESVEAHAAALGQSAHVHDVADEAAWIQIVGAVATRFNRLDVLVNNAGYGWLKPVVDTPLAEWRRLMAVNVDGTFLGMKQALSP